MLLFGWQDLFQKQIHFQFGVGDRSDTSRCFLAMQVAG